MQTLLGVKAYVTLAEVIIELRPFVAIVYCGSIDTHRS